MRPLLESLMAEVDAEIDEAIADAKRFSYIQIRDLLLIHGVDLTGVACTRRNYNTLFWMLVESYQAYRAARYRAIKAQLENPHDSTKRIGCDGSANPELISGADTDPGRG